MEFYRWPGRTLWVWLVVITTAAAAQNDIMTLNFNKTDFSHRWSKGNQHEFTPSGQEELVSWTEMMTLVVYPEVIDGDDLSVVANNVLGFYKQRGKIVRTDSKRRTFRKPAEHLIVAILGDPGFLEAAFARLIIADELGIAIVYSYRIYGSDVGDAMSAWLKEKGPGVESALMEWDGLPPVTAIRLLQTPPPKSPAWIESIRNHLSRVRSSEKPLSSEPEPLPDVAKIVGQSMNEVVSAFGNPDITTTTKHGFTVELPSNQGLDWVYNFYKLQPNARGGGLELMINFNSSGRCTAANWRRTQ